MKFKVKQCKDKFQELKYYESDSHRQIHPDVFYNLLILNGKLSAHDGGVVKGGSGEGAVSKEESLLTKESLIESLNPTKRTNVSDSCNTISKKENTIWFSDEVIMFNTQLLNDIQNKDYDTRLEALKKLVFYYQ